MSVSREEFDKEIKKLEQKLCCKTRYFDTFEDFPEIGTSKVLYIDKEKAGIYIWNGEEYLQSLIDPSPPPISNTEWGNITGNLSNQTDLKNALTAKVPYIGAGSDVNLGEFGIQLGNIEFDTTPINIPTTAGSVYWNDTDGTLDLKLKGGSVTLQLGQEEVIRIVNKTNANLLESEYKVVRIRTAAEGGSQGQRLAVKLAQADTKANHTGILGLVTESILNNQEGFITTFGKVRNINTTGSLQSETWIDGDSLYLSESVPGGLTNIIPLTHPVQIGYVVYAHANNGIIFVKVEEGVDELKDLHDVTITAPLSSIDILQYDTISSTWKNKPKYISTTDTLTVAGWVLVGSFYEQTLFNANITANSIVNVIPNNADYQTIVNAQLLPSNDSAAGSVKLYANNLPTTNIGVTLIILN